MTLWQYPVFLQDEWCARNPEDCFESTGGDPWLGIIFVVFFVIYFLFITK